MPLEIAIMEYFGRSNEEAKTWIKMLEQEALARNEEENPVNHPGPQDGTGVNTDRKGSETGLQSFHGLNNGE